jgi:hypothetical protein
MLNVQGYYCDSWSGYLELLKELKGKVADRDMKSGDPVEV